MTEGFYTGQRLSYDKHLCTVQYVGEVHNTKGQWLGVEWDEPNRGKHDGEHNGVKYFKCCSNKPTAASFLRLNRPRDQPQSFLESLHGKYVSEVVGHDGSLESEDIIYISGKNVEEVGFDKIVQQQARLDELKIVLLDGQRISRPKARLGAGGIPASDIEKACPNIVELDLSRNLFEEWVEVCDICRQLPHLLILRADGNRFHKLADARISTWTGAAPFTNLDSLGLDNTFISWEELSNITVQLPNLTNLSLGGNGYESITTTLSLPQLKQLNLEDNCFKSLGELKPLQTCSNLHSIVLKHNSIRSIYDDGKSPGEASTPIFSNSLEFLDLSDNAINTWTFIDQLPMVAPSLNNLRVSRNPLYETGAGNGNVSQHADDSYMLTLARVKNLSTLNYSQITPKERANAEGFYLSQIGKELSNTNEELASAIITRHPRYPELCRLYGEPAIRRSTAAPLNPNTLAARIVKLTLELDSETRTLSSAASGIPLPDPAEISVPKSFTIYNVLGVIGKYLCLPPMSLNLVWKTGEMELVPTVKDDWDDFEEDERVAAAAPAPGLMRAREEALLPRTRPLGSWMEGVRADVRVEMAR